MNDERRYMVLLEPHVSEKVSNLGDANNQYAFKVVRDATKAEIKEAVESIFEVSVLRVTTLNQKGKSKAKRGFRQVSRKKDWKKAYVRLAEGQDIDFVAER